MVTLALVYGQARGLYVLAGMDEQQITTAVEECIERCKNSPAIMVCVAEYVLRLRDVNKWDVKDADEVGRRVFRLIREQTA